MKMQLDKIEQSLLEELAVSKTNLLENKELLQSLNKAKENADTIASSLAESAQLQTNLVKERSTYLPLAETGSKLYFVIGDLYLVNHMYRYSLQAILKLFERTLNSQKQVGSISSPEAGNSSS